jgi:hypothetical protein
MDPEELIVGVIVGVGVGVKVIVGVGVGVGVGDGLGLIPQGSPVQDEIVVALTSPGGPMNKGSHGYVVVENGDPPKVNDVVIVVPDS